MEGAGQRSMGGAGQRSSGPSGCGHRVALSRCSRDASRRELCSAGSISGQSRLVAGKASVYGSDVYVGGYTGMIKSRGISPRNDQSRDLEPARPPPTQPRSPPAYPPPSSLAYTDKKKSATLCIKNGAAQEHVHAEWEESASRREESRAYGQHVAA